MFTQRFLSSLILSILLQCTRFTECDSEKYFINHSNSKCHSQPCLTFQQFEANASNLLKNDTVLWFSSGIHRSPSNGLNIANKERFSSNSENMDTIIMCNNSAVFKFNNVTMITITNLTFKECGKAYPGAKAIFNVIKSTIRINHCTFINSKGKNIEINSSKAIITTSIFNLSYDKALTATANSIVNVTDSVYEQNNSPQESILSIDLSIASFKNCTFHYNSATIVIHTQRSTLELKECELTNNKARRRIIRSENCIINIHKTTFKHNSVGVVLILFNCISSINSSTFIGNTAKMGILSISKGKAKSYGKLIIQKNKVRRGVLLIYQSEVQTYGKLIIQKNRVKWGVLLVDQGEVQIYGSVLIQANKARLHNIIIYFHKSIVKLENLLFLNNSGCILIEESTTEFINSSTFSNNKQNATMQYYEFGGAITSIWSTVHFKGTAIFSGNKSLKVGGAILAIESRLYVNATISFNDNLAEQGGGIYLDNSNFICNGNCSFNHNRASKGGAIHAITSVIFIGHEWHRSHQTQSINKSATISFVNNLADDRGGGLSLEANGKLQGPLDTNYKYTIEFNNNTANKGGAIYVDDYTISGTCDGKRYLTCFLNTPYYRSIQWNGQIKISSESGKNTIYGGLLDRCISRSHFTDTLNENHYITGIEYLKDLTKNSNFTKMVASDPVRICYCQGQNLNCTSNYQQITARNGQTFNVTVTAVDQVNSSVHAEIYVKYQLGQTHIGTGQEVQTITDKCSNLLLSVYSLNESVNLTLYAKGPCKDKGISKYTLHLHLLPCMCPVGFQTLTTKEDKKCSCDCALELRSLSVICDQTSQSLLRQDDFWINYTNDSGTIHYTIFSHCPYDYCLPPTSNVSVNLNLPNGIDAQCVDSRTGLLCSSCKSDLSLSLGSTLCLPCPKEWPKVFVFIVLGVMVSGVALVMMILILNLTVTIGTLNGLVFYANIMASNHYPLSQSSFFSGFISWLNLELGIDTCFYKGMDAYSKAWLQFAFPTYLIAVLIIVVIVSKYSSRFAKLIGKRNPVATFATLILLSYTKVIRNIIDIFSVAVVHYYGFHKLLWLPDANVEYLHGKHLPLFFMATVIIAIGLPYTILLFTWQWLLKAPDHKLLRWIRNTRLNLFMEANLAAYNPKHRYWSGLRLLIRVALYLEIAYYNPYEINASILATGLIAACLLFAKILYRNKVYKNRMIDHLDSFSYLNLLILSIAQLYSQNNKRGKIIAAKISVSVAFLQFIFVLTYHTVITLLEIPCLRRLNSSLAQRLQKELTLNKLSLHPQEFELITQALSTHVNPTSTEVGLSDSIEASGTECEEQERVPQTFTTKWVETNTLREPLLQEELINRI